MAIAILPDTERRTSYSITASTGPLNVGFNILGDGTDYAQWIEVWLDGEQLTPVTDFTVDSPSGSLATIARPITDARVTLVASTTGDIEIVGARRPRRTTQFVTGAAIEVDDHNRAYTDIMAVLREYWDKFQRAILVAPGQAATTAAEVIAAAATAVAAAATAVAAADGVYNSYDYETRATAAAAEIPVIRTFIRVGRHTAGYPLDPAPYKPGTVAGPMAFQDALGNYWELDLSSGRAGAAWFGARGNGIANDTTAIQAALNALPRVVYLLEGDFITSADLTLPTGVSIEGCDVRTPTTPSSQSAGTTIRTTHANAKAIKTSFTDLTDTTGAGRSYNNNISNLSIVRSSGSATNSRGLYLAQLNYSVIRNVTVGGGFATGIELCGYGLLNRFENVQVDDTGGNHAVYCHTNLRANTFVGCYFVCTTANKACVAIAATAEGAVNNLTFLGCRFDADGTGGDIYGFVLSGPGTLLGGNTVQAIWIGGCYFDMSATGTEYGIYQNPGAYFIHAVGNQMTGVANPYFMNDPDNFVVVDHSYGSGRLRSQQFCIYDDTNPNNVIKAVLRWNETRVVVRNSTDADYEDFHAKALLYNGGLYSTGGTASATAGAATLSQFSGVITSESITTAAGAEYTLTLTNTKITTGSMVFASVALGTSSQGTPTVTTVKPQSGSVVIKVKNDHASLALNGTIIVSFFVVKQISDYP